MQTKITKKTFFLTLLFLAAGFCVTCSDPITAPGLTGGARTLTDQRSAKTQILSEMSEDECVAFIIKNGVTIPDAFIDHPELGDFVKG